MPKNPNIESVYKVLVENMNEAIWMGDEHEVTIYANPKFCELMEYSLNEMLGRQSYEFWDEESANRVRDTNHAKRKKGIASSYEGNLLTKSGKLIPVLLSGSPTPEGGTVGIMTDLRELKRSEESEKLLSQAVDQASNGIIVLDSRFNIYSWNKGAKAIFGYKKEAILGKPIFSIFDEVILGRELLSAQGRPFELRARHKNKFDLRTMATVNSVQTSNKDPHYLLLVRDITNQAKTEEELALKYEKIKLAYNDLGLVRRQMDYIFDFLEFAEANDDEKTITKFIVTSIIMLTQTDACTYRKYNSEKGTLDIVSCFGFEQDWYGKATTKFQGSLAQKAVQQGFPLKVLNLANEPLYDSIHLARKYNLCSALIIPIQHKDRLIGMLTLYVTPHKKLEIFENEFIEKYAQLIGTVMSRF